MNTKRIAYSTQLKRDLKLAIENNSPPEMIADLQQRLAALQAYKQAWHKQHYVPTGNPRGPRKGSSRKAKEPGNA